MFLTFPEDARRNAERQAVEFGVEIGEYQGVVRIPRRTFQRLVAEQLIPERCIGAPLEVAAQRGAEKGKFPERPLATMRCFCLRLSRPAHSRLTPPCDPSTVEVALRRIVV